MDEWISVNKELPKETQKVIFICKNGDMFCGECFVHPSDINHNGWYDWVIYGSKGRRMRGRAPTHWMPIPELPQN